jgi:hypothetical protein
MPFSNTAWTSPEADLSPEDFCTVCLIDENESGKQKVKGLCKLPVRATPNGPYNVNAIHAATGAHGILAVQASPDAKRKAAKKLISLYGEMKEEVPEGVKRIAGAR